MLDALGQDLKVGDRIVYPGRHSSNLYLQEGEIVKVTEPAGEGTRRGSITVRNSRRLAPFSSQYSHRRVVVNRTDLVIRAPRT